MKILLTGKTGQVGYELERSLQGLGEIVAVDRSQMNLLDIKHMREVIRSVKPDLIVNAAAFTSVEMAENEPELAMRINGHAPAIMAEEAKRLGAAMIHYSTDYVFDGSKCTAYVEEDLPCPINVYGQTKLAGEQAILASGIPHLILRTSWVYGMRGNNFLLTVLRLAREGRELRIVDDQHGAPTWCRTLADACANVVVKSLESGHANHWWQEHSGIYHLTAQGKTTWYGFAHAVLRHSSLGSKLDITPISSDAYIPNVKRPLNSTLNCDHWLRSFCGLPNWEDALNSCQLSNKCASSF